MKIVFLSDTHGHHRQARLPAGDILIHGGDFASGPRERVLEFLDWFDAQPHPQKIFIAGNMDYAMENHADYFRSILPENMYYLENESVKIEGLHFWGSPVIPNFVGVFNYPRGAQINAFWEKIPEKVDVLVTHTPPFGILDKTSTGHNVGCKDLRKRVSEIRPGFHFFGHIHESYGKMEKEGITFVNGSFVKRWRPGNEPVVLTLP